MSKKSHRKTCSKRRAKLEEAVKLGYLGHEQDCRKGQDSPTCTCGVMQWLPEAVGILHTCECLPSRTQTPRRRGR